MLSSRRAPTPVAVSERRDRLLAPDGFYDRSSGPGRRPRCQAGLARFHNGYAVSGWVVVRANPGSETSAVFQERISNRSRSADFHLSDRMCRDGGRSRCQRAVAGGAAIERTILRVVSVSRRIRKLAGFQYLSSRSLQRLQVPAHWPREDSRRMDRPGPRSAAQWKESRFHGPDLADTRRAVL